MCNKESPEDFLVRTTNKRNTELANALNNGTNESRAIMCPECNSGLRAFKDKTSGDLVLQCMNEGHQVLKISNPYFEAYIEPFFVKVS